MINLNTNLLALTTRRSIDNSTKLLNQAIERMSTGFKINSAKDNAANFAIATQMTTQLNSLDVAEDNVAQGIDLLTTANDTLDLINSRYTRLRDLAIQAQNETIGKESLKAINIECNALVEDIKTMYKQAEYNGLKIYGAEFFETISTDNTSPAQVLAVDPIQSQSLSTFANENTTLQELGINNSSFQIYNAEGELIESYETEKSDTLKDIFEVLSIYGFTSSITNGVISIESSNGRYVNGDLMQEFGISLNETEFVISSTQNSNNAVYYTATLTATEETTLADMGVLTSGTDVVSINDKYGDLLGKITVNSSTTFGGLFNSLGNYDIQGEIDDGVITLSSSKGNYVKTEGIIASLGIGTNQSSSVVTTGTSQTSAGIVTYETVVTTGGEVTTTQQEQIVTIWTTTTTSETVTETIWTTSTTSEETTETIWTTTTSSTTQTVATGTVTLTTTATLETTLGELGISDGMKLVSNTVYSDGTLYERFTITVSSSNSLYELISKLENENSSDLNYDISLENGILTVKNQNNHVLTGEVADKLNITTRTWSGEYTTSWVNATCAIDYTTSDDWYTNTVTTGEFLNEVTRIDTSTIESLSFSLMLSDTIKQGTTYKISTSQELQQLSLMVNNDLYEASSWGSVTIILTSDIDMSGIYWEPIERLSYCNFEGNGYVISGLSAPLLLTNATNSTIKNLGLVVDETFTCGEYWAGVLACDYDGDIDNCFVTGTITNIINSYRIGGLVGQANYSNITNCYTDINYDLNTDSNFDFGGLVGYAVSGNFENCYTLGNFSISANRGSNIGGLIGHLQTEGTLNSVYSAMTFSGDIDGYGDNNATVGGIIGQAYSINYLYIDNAYFSGELNIQNDYYSNGESGGIISYLYLSANNTDDIYINNINSVEFYNDNGNLGNLIGNYDQVERGVNENDKLEDIGLYTDTITIDYADGTTSRTITIDNTKTIKEFAEELKNYGVDFYIDNPMYVVVFKPQYGVTISSSDWNSNSYETFTVTDNTSSGIISRMVTNTVLAENTAERGFIQAISVRDTSTMTSFASISETAYLSSGTYSISTTEELMKLSTMVNNIRISYNVEFVLANNIDMSGVTNFVPIGYYGGGFRANFDGNGYSIKNLTINCSQLYATNGSYSIGLFGSADYGTIKNLGIDNMTIVEDSEEYKEYQGGLIGDCRNLTIINCYTTGSCYNLNGKYAGGLIGKSNNATIISCYADWNLEESGQIDYLGGLIGYMDTGTIAQCFTSGNYKGTSSSAKIAGLACGVAGDTIAIIENCYSTANIDNQNGNFAGITVGKINFSYTDTRFENCYSNTTGNYDEYGYDNSPDWNGTEFTYNLKNPHTGLGDAMTSVLMETTTYQVTTTTSSTETTTVWITTSSSTTKTETVFVTTTTQTTETQTTDVLTTAPIVYTTSNVSVTAGTTFSKLGLTSRAYITIQNDNTSTIVTIKTGDTVQDLITKLNNSNITTSLNNGYLAISPNSKSAYISGMSQTLIDAFNLESDFYSTSLGVEMTDSNLIVNNDAVITIKQSTSLSEIGVTSGELVVKKDGNDTATIAVSDFQSVAEFVTDLQNAGFNAYCTNGVISLNASGDMYLADSAATSSNAINVLKLTNVSQQKGVTYSNTNSDEINKLSQIVVKTWKASSPTALQIGTGSDEHSRIEISIGFTLKEIDRFSNIGKNMVNNIDYIAELDDILGDINRKQAEIGAGTNRLESALEEISIKYDNLVSSRSTIRDADLAEESAIYIQQQILQQASATLLAVANQNPQLALQLI